MKLNEHQLKLWKSMIQLIDEYFEGRITFGDLVPSLEGLLDSSEIKDNELIKVWYDFWTPLEIINADKEGNVSNEEKEEIIQKMRNYLLNTLETQ